MPYNLVMPKWKKGELHSGSKEGPIVKNKNQAVAIMLSEKREAAKGKEEYKPVKKYQDGGSVSGRAQAIPFGGPKNPTKGSPFPKVGSNPALRELSPEFAPDKEKMNRPQPDYPSHTVAAKKGGKVTTKFQDAGDVRSVAPVAPVVPTPVARPVARPTAPLPPPRPQRAAPAQAQVLPGAPSFQPTISPIVTAKKGGPMKKFASGGSTEEWEGKNPIREPKLKPGTFPRGTAAREEWQPQQSPGIQPWRASPLPSVTVGPASAPDTTALNKGGKVCASNAKVFKQNLAETAANPTVGLAKGGEINKEEAYKKPSWRRW